MREFMSPASSTNLLKFPPLLFSLLTFSADLVSFLDIYLISITCSAVIWRKKRQKSLITSTLSSFHSAEPVQSSNTWPVSKDQSCSILSPKCWRSDWPVVHEQVWFPDLAGRDADVLDTVVLRLVPGQVNIGPLLATVNMQYPAFSATWLDHRVNNKVLIVEQFQIQLLDRWETKRKCQNVTQFLS